MANITVADKYSINEKKPELFSDFHIDLLQHPGKRDLVRVVNENSIKRSIINLLNTDYYERLYQPYLGANLKHLLFEPSDEQLLSSLKQQILTCIGKFEPRAKVTSIALTTTPDELGVHVALTFVTINNPVPTTLNTILNRVR